MNGLHLVADLYRCTGTSPLLLDSAALETLCVGECAEAGLTPLGSYFYPFTHDDGQQPVPSSSPSRTWPSTPGRKPAMWRSMSTSAISAVTTASGRGRSSRR